MQVPRALRFPVVPVATLGLATCLLAGPVGAAPQPRPSAPATQVETAEFMEAFRAAMKVNDKGEMELLVEKNVDEAIQAVKEICDKIAVQSSAQLEEEIDALGSAWKAAFDSRFVYKQYEYASLLRGEYVRARSKLLRRYDIELNKYWQAREQGGNYVAIGLELEGIGGAFEEIGDFFSASWAFYFAAQCFDEEIRGDEADFKRACELYGRMMEMRDEMELVQDRFYTYSRERFLALDAGGYGDPDDPAVVGAGEEVKGEGPPAEGGGAAPDPEAPVALNASFELVSDFEGVARPYYMADDVYQMWPWVWLTENGSQGSFPTMREGGPSVLRLGAVKAAVDADGDGEGDVEFSLGGPVAPLEFTLGSGDAARPWALLVASGRQDDTYQGFRYNLEPTESQMMIYVAPAASIVGTFGDVDIRVFDDNMDGVYGSLPSSWGYIGLREGDFEPTMDSVQIGDEKTARPWSRLNRIGDEWYTFIATESNDVVLEKADVETGTLVLDMKGPSADWMVVVGEGSLADCYFDLLADGKKGTEVPVGTYKLFCGRVSKGKRAQVMKALVMPTKNTRQWKVAAGETVEVELGAPFGFEFEFEQNDETVEVKGSTIFVKGRGEETYQRLWNCVVHPEVNLRKAGSKRGGKEGKLQPATSQEEIVDNGDQTTAWFPISVPIPKKKKGEEVEVQLVEKKNKLFGKIESDWKAE